MSPPASLRTAILVGAGNIGSRLAMQLPLVGARRLVLIDPDTVSRRNLRCCEAFGPAEVRRPKVAVLARRVRRRHRGVDVLAVRASLDRAGLALLRGRSPAVLIGAVDSRRARYELARAALLLDMPLIDLATASGPDEALARARTSWWTARPIDPLNAWSADDWQRLEQAVPCGRPREEDPSRPIASPVSGALAAGLGLEQLRKLWGGDLSDVGFEIRLDGRRGTAGRLRLPAAGLSPLDPGLAIRRSPVRVSCATLGELVDAAEGRLGPDATIRLNRPICRRFACPRCGPLRRRLRPVADAGPCRCGRTPLALEPVWSIGRPIAASLAAAPVRALGARRDLLCAVTADGARFEWLECGAEP